MESCQEYRVAGVEFRIRPAEAADAAEIARIHHQHLGSATLDLEERPASYFHDWNERLTAAGRQGIWVLEGPETELLGWGVLKRYSDREGYAGAAETSVFLDRAAQGQGHGTRLKRFLIERCREHEYHYVVARILAANEVSIRYNEKLGYRRVGIQSGIGVVEGKRLDVCILELHLE